MPPSALHDTVQATVQGVLWLSLTGAAWTPPSPRRAGACRPGIQPWHGWCGCLRLRTPSSPELGVENLRNPKRFLWIYCLFCTMAWLVDTSRSGQEKQTKPHQPGQRHGRLAGGSQRGYARGQWGVPAGPHPITAALSLVASSARSPSGESLLITLPPSASRDPIAARVSGMPLIEGHGAEHC